MNAHEGERRGMVRHQLEQQGIKDPRVLEAMTRVPRHQFVDPERWHEAYLPRAVPIGEGQTISQPYMVALMTELLQLRGDEWVLEIGTGSGYQAAILAHLAAVVVTIERLPRLAVRAKRLLEECAPPRVLVLVADGSRGAPVRVPFDRIIVTAAAPEVPVGLLAQLADPGILVCPVGDRHLQVLHRIVRQDGKDQIDRSCPCRFVPLVGEGGWQG
jgi:protein-L-isoaspartate(D-aspartate) O-methyltransferase